MTDSVGKVFLVGSGTGNADYLTVQAQRLLTTAEVLLYDALVDGALLQLAPATCVTIEVGKRGGQPSLKQAEINRLLIEYAQQGKQVVRLKSGDPFIFGRSQSEIQVLREAGCPFEVVPGVSSALVAPLLAGIPLTDPVLSRSFTVLTAHDPAAIDWQTLSQVETLVILMGGQTLPEILRQLQRAGRSPQTPIAIIQWASRPEQRIWDGTLANILQQTEGESLPPCVIVIGEVVRLRAFLQSPVALAEHRTAPISLPLPEARTNASLDTVDATVDATVLTDSDPTPTFPTRRSPLRGKTVLVTRSATQSPQFSDRLVAEGATVIEMPALEIVPPSSWEGLDRAIARLQEFDWLVFTSGNSVDYFFERLFAQLTGLRALSNIRIAVVGEKTAQKLKERGLQPDFVPPEYVADSLAVHFPGSLQGAQVLFPRVETGGRDLLVKDLTAKGATVTEIAAYQSRCPETIAPEPLAALQAGTVDVVTFASAKTVKHFCQLLERAHFDASWQTYLKPVCIASIGPQTSKACETLLGRVDAEAQEFTIDGLVRAISDWFEPPA
jgi:uroporphyrinogen III methyltransferase/synthase